MYCWFNLSDAISEQSKCEAIQCFELPLKPLAKFEGALKLAEQSGILFGAADYLELVDTSGRILREDKRGGIKTNLPPILDRLQLDLEAWLTRTKAFEGNYVELFAAKRKHRKAA